MNWDRIEGNWKTFKGQVRQKWGKLTDDDIDVIEGKRTELAGRLQQRYGVAKDQAERDIDTWLKSVNLNGGAVATPCRARARRNGQHRNCVVVTRVRWMPGAG